MALAEASRTTEWSYEEAFCRNRGLISPDEQQRLRRATVAIAGMGGVGSGHALTLARQGVGGFHLIDPDTFSVANFNRQVGARVSSLGQNKAAEIRRMILDINPEARVRVWEAPLDQRNVAEFLAGTDVALDGLDYFALEPRRLLFRSAQERGLWTLTAGPLGFSAILIAVSPRGMSFDAYCGFGPQMTSIAQIAAFSVAIAPRATQMPYMDYTQIDVKEGIGPSSIVGCQLCSSVITTAALAVLLDWSPPPAAPCYLQFDARRQILRRGRLLFGGRGPLQRLKRYILERRIAALIQSRS